MLCFVLPPPKGTGNRTAPGDTHMTDVDICIVGGGIVALSTAMQLLERYPALTVAVLEKEKEIGLHQTSHNSGVLHAGVYYAPGSLKAEFCRIGVAATVRFCHEHGIAIEQCGKLLVATDALELARMASLEARSRLNKLATERLDARELAQREPSITGLGALFISKTGIVDWRRVALAMAERFRDAGGALLTEHEVSEIHEGPGDIAVATSKGPLRARHLIACGGLMADRLARLCGIEMDFRIIPFRGEYFRLPSSRNGIIRHLIYPIPDPAMPFLGVHLTRMIDGYVTVGPNAVLGFAREAYRRRNVNLRDIGDYLAFPGFWRMLRAHFGSALSELGSSLSRRRYLQLCRKYCPELTLDDLLPHRAGVRAQAVLRDGTLVHDFLIRRTARTIHVCNAPSPAATCSLPIGAHLTGLAAEHFSLP
jgi:(S)-2-hydroxyglutarate dehydrogenase